MRIVSLFIICIQLILISGCSGKEKSKDWLEGEITVLSELNGAPVRRYIQLKYTETSYFFGSHTTRKNLGMTDVNGKLKIDVQVPRKAYYSLGIQTSAANFYSTDPQQYVSVSNKKKNELVVLTPAVCYYSTDIINANCSGAEDSMWLNNAPIARVGCYTSIYPDGVPPSQYAYPTVSYHVKVKRNGIVTEFDKEFTVVPEIHNKFVLEY